MNDQTIKRVDNIARKNESKYLSNANFRVGKYYLKLRLIRALNTLLCRARKGERRHGKT